MQPYYLLLAKLSSSESLLWATWKKEFWIKMEEDYFKEILLERMKTSVNMVVKFCDVLKIVDSTFVSAFLTLSECSTHC